MKEHWPRHVPAVAMDAAAIGQLVLPLFPGESIRTIEEVKGGLTNTNYKIGLAHRATPLLLRIFQRGVPPAQKEAAIDRLVGHRVSVPHFIHFAEESPVTGHPYAVLDWIEGADLQHLYASMPRERLVALAPSIGAQLATIHSFTFDMFGFFDADLKVQGPIDFDQSGLLAYLDQCLNHGLGGARLGAELGKALVAYVTREGHILSDWPGPPRLVHGDFNGSNILLRPRPDAPCDDITAIIDWEYAISAPPSFDFGNLLRPPLDDNPAFAEGVARGYRDAGGKLPPDWQRIARLADMFSFTDLLGRPETGAIIVEDAKHIIRKLLAS